MALSRSDLYGWGLTFVGVALGYLVGGPMGALFVLLLGVVFIVLAHMRTDEKDAATEGGIIFAGPVPVPPNLQDDSPVDEKDVAFNLQEALEHAGGIRRYRIGITNRKAKPLNNIKVWVTEPKPDWLVESAYAIGLPFRLWRPAIGSEPDGCSINPGETEWFDFLRWWISSEKQPVVELPIPNAQLPAPVESWSLRVAANWSEGSQPAIVNVCRVQDELQLELGKGQPEPQLQTKPNFSLGYGFSQVVSDPVSEVWTERFGAYSTPSTACVLQITNSPHPDGWGTDANEVRAQIDWTYDTGFPGPSFSPAMWVNEPCGKVDIPVGWRKTLLIGIKSTHYWYGADNRRINVAEQPQSHSEIVPRAGTMLVKIISDRGEVLFKAKLGWSEDLYTFHPTVTQLPIS
jgi:hypothetical protein